MKDFLTELAVVLCCLILPRAATLADDWPHWRGPNRNSIVDEASGWTADGWRAAESAWKQNVGEGSTSPIVVGDHLFVMGWHEQKDFVYCLNAKTGKEDWSVSYECPQYGRLATGDEGLYSGPTAMPIPTSSNDIALVLDRITAIVAPMIPLNITIKESSRSLLQYRKKKTYSVQDAELAMVSNPLPDREAVSVSAVAIPSRVRSLPLAPAKESNSISR